VPLSDIDHIVTNILFVTGRGIEMRIGVKGGDQPTIAANGPVQTGVAHGKVLSDAVLAATLT
jgi:hypothetical protein